MLPGSAAHLLPVVAECRVLGSCPASAAVFAPATYIPEQAPADQPPRERRDANPVRRRSSSLFGDLLVFLRQNVGRSSHPGVERRQQHKTQRQTGQQSTYDLDGEGTLRI